MICARISRQTTVIETILEILQRGRAIMVDSYLAHLLYRFSPDVLFVSNHPKPSGLPGCDLILVEPTSNQDEFFHKYPVGNLRSNSKRRQRNLENR